MKKNNDFYKVVNTVVKSLDSTGIVWTTRPLPTLKVYYVDSEKGAGCFTEDDILGEKGSDTLRDNLLQYNYCEEVDADDVLPGFPSETSDYDVWQLSMGGKGAYIQIALDPSEYVDISYDLRDMICDEEGLEAAEITEGMNGYPRRLRGCVLLSGCGKTIEEMEKIAERYGVELVSLHQRAGWHLWESEGWTNELYDFARFMEDHNDNLHYWESYKDYANELREYAEDGDMDEELKQEFLDAAEKADGMELAENEFLYCEHGYPYLTEPERANRMVDNFGYDTHIYTLALDCRIDE